MPDALELLKTRRSVKPIELAGPGPTRGRDRHAADHRLARARPRQARRRGASSCSRATRALKAGAAIAAAFRAESSRRQRRAGRVRAQAARARAAGDRGGQPRRAACEDPGMGAGAVGRRRRDEPGASPRTRWAMPRAGSPNGTPMTARVLDALGLAPHERIAGFVHIGRPAQAAGGSRPRPPLAEIVTRYPAVAEKPRRRCSTTTDKNDHGLPHDPFKAIVAPRPIGWITSMSAKGEINLAPYSFFNGVTEPAADRDVRQRRPQGFGRLRRGDQGVRLQSRDLGLARADERHLGAAAARRQRDGASRA